jgi:hypothetical protein
VDGEIGGHEVHEAITVEVPGGQCRWEIEEGGAADVRSGREDSHKVERAIPEALEEIDGADLTRTAALVIGQREIDNAGRDSFTEGLTGPDLISSG